MPLVLVSKWGYNCKCKTFHMKMSFRSLVIKTHFHIKGFALDLTLKLRQNITQKWPIKSAVLDKLTEKFLPVPTVWSASGPSVTLHVKQHIASWTRLELTCYLLGLNAFPAQKTTRDHGERNGVWKQAGYHTKEKVSTSIYSLPSAAHGLHFTLF